MRTIQYYHCDTKIDKDQAPFVAFSNCSSAAYGSNKRSLDQLHYESRFRLDRHFGGWNLELSVTSGTLRYRRIAAHRPRVAVHHGDPAARVRPLSHSRDGGTCFFWFLFQSGAGDVRDAETCQVVARKVCTTMTSVIFRLYIETNNLRQWEL